MSSKEIDNNVVICWRYLFLYNSQQCTTLIKNNNFFEAHLDNITVQVNWDNYVVADPDIPGIIKVPARSSLNVC